MRCLFWVEDVEVIQTLLIYRMPNLIDLNETFSTKSVYKRYISSSFLLTASSSTSTNKWWKVLWHLKILIEIQIIRRVSISPRCICCGRDKETMGHMFHHCKTAKKNAEFVGSIVGIAACYKPNSMRCAKF